MTKICLRYRNIDIPFINIGWMVGVWVGGFLCKGDQEPHIILYISDKNGTSKLNKLAIFDKKWNFWNLVAMFDKKPCGQYMAIFTFINLVCHKHVWK